LDGYSVIVNRHVLVLNGPNIDRLGTREPDIYGRTSYPELVKLLVDYGTELGLAVEVRQSASESEMISWLHEAADSSASVIINPAAFTHYSYALRDACALIESTLIEVHISNPATREDFRHQSVISGVATGVIAGFGVDSYRLALFAIASQGASSES
jgi:3-dehydroquinate dehydratase-2